MAMPYDAYGGTAGTGTCGPYFTILTGTTCSAPRDEIARMPDTVWLPPFPVRKAKMAKPKLTGSAWLQRFKK